MKAVMCTRLLRVIVCSYGNPFSESGLFGGNPFATYYGLFGVEEIAKAYGAPSSDAAEVAAGAKGEL